MLLYDCKKASIYSLEHTFLCDASVSHVREDSAILTINGSAADFLTSEIYVTFYDGIKGLVTYFCELTDYKEEMPAPDICYSSVHCTVRDEISVLQRRNDVKIPVNIPVKVVMSSDPSRGAGIPAIIRNISAGGVFFICRRNLPKDMVVSFTLPLKKNAPALVLRVRILRVQDPGGLRDIIGSEADDDQLQGYGCCFVHTSPTAEAQIRNYVLHEDIIRKRKLRPLV